MFNARKYFDQPELEPLGYSGKLHYRTPLYRRIDAGATIGGPLSIPHFYTPSKLRTFFFFPEEVRREKTPEDYDQAVLLTVAERAGNFSDICPQFEPGDPDFQSVRLSGLPAGRSWWEHRLLLRRHGSVSESHRGCHSEYRIIPEPNSIGGCNTTNPTTQYRCYLATLSPPTQWHEELFRIDHDLTSNERLSFRYIHDSWNTVTLAPQWGVVQSSFPTVENQLNGPGLNLVASLAQTLPHGFVNLLSVSYAVEHINLKPQPGPGLTTLSCPGSAG